MIEESEEGKFFLCSFEVLPGFLLSGKPGGVTWPVKATTPQKAQGHRAEVSPPSHLDNTVFVCLFVCLF